MMENYSDPLFREAMVWAELDGCEGGDLLRSLVYWADKAQDGYGYALSPETEKHLRQAIQSEIREQEAMDYYEYQDRDFVDQCLRQIKGIREETGDA